MAKFIPYEESFGEDRAVARVVGRDRNMRVIRFCLLAGQEIKPHRSPSTVLMTVLKGRLVFVGGEEEMELKEGDALLCAPGEPHGFRALEDSVVEAVVSPNPSEGTFKVNLT